MANGQFLNRPNKPLFLDEARRMGRRVDGGVVQTGSPMFNANLGRAAFLGATPSMEAQRIRSNFDAGGVNEPGLTNRERQTRFMGQQGVTPLEQGRNQARLAQARAEFVEPVAERVAGDVKVQDLRSRSDQRIQRLKSGTESEIAAGQRDVDREQMTNDLTIAREENTASLNELSLSLAEKASTAGLDRVSKERIADVGAKTNIAGKMIDSFTANAQKSGEPSKMKQAQNMQGLLKNMTEFLSENQEILDETSIDKMGSGITKLVDALTDLIGVSDVDEGISEETVNVDLPQEETEVVAGTEGNPLDENGDGNVSDEERETLERESRQVMLEYSALPKDKQAAVDADPKLARKVGRAKAIMNEIRKQDTAFAGRVLGNGA